MMQDNRGEGRKPVKVIFCTRSSFGEASEDNVVKITPSDDNWNDFGQRTRVEIFFHTKDTEKEVYTTGLIGIIDAEGKSHGREYLKKLFSDDVDQVASNDCSATIRMTG
jgi:hypothetical protein